MKETRALVSNKRTIYANNITKIVMMKKKMKMAAMLTKKMMIEIGTMM